MSELYTIGHSNHSTEKFIELLLKHEITAVCDVRSQPYSKFNPQFNRENIQKELKQSNIAYVFLGRAQTRHNGRRRGECFRVADLI